MLLLIDENVPNSVAEFFKERGHEVSFARDLLPLGSPDPVVANIGDLMGAIVVTWNRKDFARLAARIPEAGQPLFRRLGRINFRCKESFGRQRAEQVIEWIEFEYSQVQKQRDKRLIMEIGTTFIRIIR